MSLRPASTTARSSSALGGTTQDVGSRTSRQQPPQAPRHPAAQGDHPLRRRSCGTPTRVRIDRRHANYVFLPGAMNIKYILCASNSALVDVGDDGSVDVAQRVGAARELRFWDRRRVRTSTLAALRRPTSAALGNGILRPETAVPFSRERPTDPPNRRRRPRYPLKRREIAKPWEPPPPIRTSWWS